MINNFFKNTKIYMIEGYYYLIFKGNGYINEDYEPVIKEVDGKTKLLYKAVDSKQFSDNTYNNVKCRTLEKFLMDYGYDKSMFNNPFTRELKIIKEIININYWEENKKNIDLRLSDKALEEIEYQKFLIKR